MENSLVCNFVQLWILLAFSLLETGGILIVKVVVSFCNGNFTLAGAAFAAAQLQIHPSV